VFGAPGSENSMKNIHYRYKQPLFNCKNKLPGWTIDIDDLTSPKADFLIEVVTKPQSAKNLKKSIVALRTLALNKCDETALAELQKAIKDNCKFNDVASMNEAEKAVWKKVADYVVGTALVPSVNGAFFPPKCQVTTTYTGKELKAAFDSSPPAGVFAENFQLPDPNSAASVWENAMLAALAKQTMGGKQKPQNGLIKNALEQFDNNAHAQELMRIAGAEFFPMTEAYQPYNENLEHKETQSLYRAHTRAWNIGKCMTRGNMLAFMVEFRDSGLTKLNEAVMKLLKKDLKQNSDGFDESFKRL